MNSLRQRKCHLFSERGRAARNGQGGRTQRTARTENPRPCWSLQSLQSLQSFGSFRRPQTRAPSAGSGWRRSWRRSWRIDAEIKPALSSFLGEAKNGGVQYPPHPGSTPRRFDMNRNGLRGMAGALISLFCVTAGFAAGTVEVASKANPRRLSDTASGALSPFAVLPPPSLSADGRGVAFLRSATHLAAGQTVPAQRGLDVFLHDRISGATLLVSHSTASPTAASARGAASAVLSADGRWVAFVSESTDLVPGLPADASLSRRLFLFDRISGTTVPVSPSAYLDSHGGAGG